MEGRSAKLHTLPLDAKSGRIDIKTLDKMLADKKPAGFLFQTPNALGVLEDIKAIAEICARNNVVSVCSYNPLLSGLFTPPGNVGVDIVVCDGQVLGLPLSAGGPSLGVFATKKEYRKFVPGRLIGKVTDIRGNLAYALVYEDREQHVARERATSNICSNQALNALRAVIYLASLGEAGLEKIAALNVHKARYLAEELTTIPGVDRAFGGNFFNEFVITLPKPVKPVLQALQKEKIFAGLDYSGRFGLKNALLIAVTEVKSKTALDAFASALKKVLA
jgi:glycine dehydrogenase subunit 1